MKHKISITLLIVTLFFISQLVGIYVISSYLPKTTTIETSPGNYTNSTNYNLPYGLEPPQESNPSSALFSICISIAVAVCIIFLLMKVKAESFLRGWFFLVTILALGITINAFIIGFNYSSIIALILAIPLAFYKIFKKNVYIHNLTEVFIYPGIAAIFVPILNVWSALILLGLISLYDMYAVWHAGFMQKMAKYHVEKVKIFPGLLIPYMNKDISKKLNSLKNNKSKKKLNNIKIPVAILGGGDIVFPIILSGVMFVQYGLFVALSISFFSAIALALLLYFSKKGKSYPAMPFISLGALTGLILFYLIYL